MGELTQRVDMLVLDYLISKRGLATESALKFGELMPAGTIEALAGPSQARLMLRLLLDGHKTLSEDTITCLTILGSVDVRDVTNAAIAPPPELFAQVKMELLLQACKSGPATPEAVKAAIDHFFRDAADAPRRAELAGHFSDPAAVQQLLQQGGNVEGVKAAVMQYAQQAQALLGPPPLETIVHRGLQATVLATSPHLQQPKKRGRPSTKKSPSSGPNGVASPGSVPPSGAAESELTQRSKQLRMLGTDPGEAAQAVASNIQQQHSQQQHANQQQPSSQPQGSFVADVQAAAAEPTSAAVVDGGEGQRGRVITWDSPVGEGGTPGGNPTLAGVLNGHLHLGATSLPSAGATLVVRPLHTPGEDGQAADSKARRKIGRWREEETNELINLTRIHGRGKWKLILEKGAGTFANRTQVDLKDKWRNLCRQGAVNPDLFPSPEGRSRPRASVGEAGAPGGSPEGEGDPSGQAPTHSDAAEVPSVEAMPHPGAVAMSQQEDVIETTPSQLPAASAGMPHIVTAPKGHLADPRFVLGPVPAISMAPAAVAASVQLQAASQIGVPHSQAQPV